MHVLVCDDDNATRFAVKRMLTQHLPCTISECADGVQALDDRVNGMLQGLGDLAAEVEVVKQLPTGCAQDQGQTATEDILTSNPEVTAIYAACGPPAVGAVTAITNAGIAPEG